MRTLLPRIFALTALFACCGCAMNNSQQQAEISALRAEVDQLKATVSSLPFGAATVMECADADIHLPRRIMGTSIRVNFQNAYKHPPIVICSKYRGGNHPVLANVASVDAKGCQLVAQRVATYGNPPAEGPITFPISESFYNEELHTVIAYTVIGERP